VTDERRTSVEVQDAGTRAKAPWWHPRRWVLGLIHGYQRTLSPLLGARCRYLPSCSRYGYEAIEVHGLARGGWMAVKRVGRCHPWGGHGYDPVPGRPEPTPTEGEA
jgi:putative membrane protein insertion efficiency factor